MTENQEPPASDADWTIHSINIQGIFFERWCQTIVEQAEGWRLDSCNYPVEFPRPNGPIRGKESTLDIRASIDLETERRVLLIECKKNNPEFTNWIFFEKTDPAKKHPYRISQLMITPRDAPGSGWETLPVAETPPVRPGGLF